MLQTWSSADRLMYRATPTSHGRLSMTITTISLDYRFFPALFRLVSRLTPQKFRLYRTGLERRRQRRKIILTLSSYTYVSPWQKPLISTLRLGVCKKMRGKENPWCCWAVTCWKRPSTGRADSCVQLSQVHPRHFPLRVAR